MLNRAFIAAVGLLLVGLGIAGVWAGYVLGRSGVVRRADEPFWFWLRVAVYLAVGGLALVYSLRGLA